MRTHLLLLALAVGLVAPACGSEANALTRDEARAVVEAADRSAQDRERDARRHPVDFLLFAGVAPGMRVADLGAGGGYTAELLARAVGPEGTVYAHNTPAVIEKYVKESWPARLSKPVMENVVRVDRTWNEPLPPEVGDLDLVTMVYVYHDTLFGGVDRATMNRRIFDALRPGGSLVVVDHVAKEGAGAESGETVHRIDEALLRRELESAGFRYVASAEFMRNPEDPRDAAFFRVDFPPDTYVHRYEKPAGGAAAASAEE